MRSPDSSISLIACGRRATIRSCAALVRMRSDCLIFTDRWRPVPLLHTHTQSLSLSLTHTHTHPHTPLTHIHMISCTNVSSPDIPRFSSALQLNLIRPQTCFFSILFSLYIITMAECLFVNYKRAPLKLGKICPRFYRRQLSRFCFILPLWCEALIICAVESRDFY